jgi:glyoxylase-like metal-dependent hydrolase (beta-lactamase superfamily II)
MRAANLRWSRQSVGMPINRTWLEISKAFPGYPLHCFEHDSVLLFIGSYTRIGRQRRGKGSRVTRTIAVIAILLVVSSCLREPEAIKVTYSDHCDEVPRPGNAKLALSDASDGWFKVYETSPNTFAIVEPFHYQETISHLIVGSERALLFDTGMGFFPIRPVVDRLTKLPVTVLNSHTHYDHVGGNAEFSNILAVESDYTRANMAGYMHDRIASETVAAAFCPDLPVDADPQTFATNPWKANRYVEEGEVLDLGGRQLEVLVVPGHTPDATALLDAENGLLFTGDSYYDAPIWLFAPETSLVDYATSIARLAELEGDIRYVLGAHNEARVDAGGITKVVAALALLRQGDIAPVSRDSGLLRFEIDGIEIVSSEQALQGRQGDISKGGSGLDGW